MSKSEDVILPKIQTAVTKMSPQKSFIAEKNKKSKFKMSPLKCKDDLKIRNRIEAYKSESNTKCAVMPVLVTTYGLQKNTYSGNIRNVIVMDDLFAK